MAARRFWRAGTGLALALGAIALLVAPVGAAPAGACAGSRIWIETLDVRLKATRTVYATGDEASLSVRVTRHRLDEPMRPSTRADATTPRVAVEGAYVGLWGEVGDEYFFADGTTDSNGVVTASWPLGEATGTAIVEAHATKYVAGEGHCFEIYEHGHARADKAFTVRD